MRHRPRHALRATAAVDHEHEQQIRHLGECVNPDRPQGEPTTNAYLSRPFCVQELRWAREAGIPIQPVIRSADKQRIGDFLGAAPEDLNAGIAMADFGNKDDGYADYDDGLDDTDLASEALLGRTQF